MRAIIIILLSSAFLSFVLLTILLILIDFRLCYAITLGIVRDGVFLSLFLFTIIYKHLVGFIGGKQRGEFWWIL